jgi:hypothetical protein
MGRRLSAGAVTKRQDRRDVTRLVVCGAKLRLLSPLTSMEPSEALSLALEALTLAHTALQAAAADLLIASALAPPAALSSDARVLAQAVETEFWPSARPSIAIADGSG